LYTAKRSRPSDILGVERRGDGEQALNVFSARSRTEVSEIDRALSRGEAVAVWVAYATRCTIEVPDGGCANVLGKVWTDIRTPLRKIRRLRPHRGQNGHAITGRQPHPRDAEDLQRKLALARHH
jgi:hypothetical protein